MRKFCVLGAKELQQCQNASAKEVRIHLKLTKIDCFVVESSRLHFTFVTVCLLSVVRKQ